jgi:NTP pyrophosphatase (non-canonical NTP hydrolase)
MQPGKMSEQQERHLNSLKAEFYRLVDEKYRRGVEEHKAFVGDLPALRLLDHGIEEVLDLFVYLTTARDVITGKMGVLLATSLDLINTWRDVEQEIKGSRAAHGGPLTRDHFRALAILGEEVGEVNAAVLELERDKRKAKEDALLIDESSYANVEIELIQVMAVAAQMLLNVRAERAEALNQKEG